MYTFKATPISSMTVYNKHRWTSMHPGFALSNRIVTFYRSKESLHFWSIYGHGEH